MCSSHENTSHAAGATKIKAFDQMMPGVGVGIDLDKREVTVAGDPAIAVETIRAAGYEPQPLAQ
jgi:copper chaperone